MRWSAPRSRPVPGLGWETLARRVAALPIAGLAAWLMAWPVSADTGSPPPFVPPVEEPVGDLLRIVATVGSIVIAVVVVVGGLGLAARLVGRLGGAAAPGANARAAVRPRSNAGWIAFGAVLIAAGAAGFVTGRGMAYYSSVGGLASITSGVFGMGIVLMMVLLGVVAGAARRRRGAMSPAIASLLLAAGLLPLGAVVGAGTASMTGGIHREPVFLQAAGTTRSAIDSSEFVATEDGRADCQSVADGTAVASVTALDLGQLQGHRLRASFGVPISAGPVHLELWIDGVNLPEGHPLPAWSGAGDVVDLGDGGARGEVRFVELERAEEPVRAPSGAVVWRDALSGSISWTCQEWILPVGG